MRATDRLFEKSGKENFGVGWAVGFEGGGGHGGEFGGYDKESVEGAVGEWFGYFGGYLDEDSGDFVSLEVSVLFTN